MNCRLSRASRVEWALGRSVRAISIRPGSSRAGDHPDKAASSDLFKAPIAIGAPSRRTTDMMANARAQSITQEVATAGARPPIAVADEKL